MEYFNHDFGPDDDLKYLEWTLAIFGGCILLSTIVLAAMYPPDDFGELLIAIFSFMNGLFILLFFTIFNKAVLKEYIFRITDEGVDLYVTELTEKRFIPKKEITKAQLIDNEVLIYLKNEPPERFGLGLFWHEQNRKMLRQAFRQIDVPVHDMMEGKVYA